MADHDPASLRVVTIVADWLAEDPALPDVVGLDLRDFTNDTPDVDKPALFVIAGNTDLPLERESDLGVVDPLGVSIVGYVKAPTEDGAGAPVIPPPVTDTRERLLQRVLRRLAAGSEETDSLVKRLREDRAAVGSGAESFRQLLPVRRGELGERPPYGDFQIPCYALLHYQDGDF